MIVLDICFFDGLPCGTFCSCLNFSVDVPVSLHCKRFVMARRCRFVDLPRDSRRRKAVPVFHV